jgi:hypothetical protein
MKQTAQPESEANRLFRKMTDLKMNVGRTFINEDGRQCLNVNGYTLTVEQLIEIENQTELTSWGITDYVGKQVGALNT